MKSGTKDILLVGGAAAAAYLLFRKKPEPKAGSLQSWAAGNEGLVPDSLQSFLSGLTSGVIPRPARFRGEAAPPTITTSDNLNPNATPTPDYQAMQEAIQMAVQKQMGNIAYTAAVARSRQARNIPLGGGNYITRDTTGKITGAGHAGPIRSFTQVYNANFKVAGADHAPAPNAGAVVAKTIGGSSENAWFSNLTAKGMNAHDARRIAHWHASRGETIQG